MAVGRFTPDPRSVAAVALVDHGAELLRPARHRPGEAVKGRLLREDPLELTGIHVCDRAGVERAQAPFELTGPGERLLDGHLLVETEADQERQRIAGEELVRLVVRREVEPAGGGGRHAAILRQRDRAIGRTPWREDDDA